MPTTKDLLDFADLLRTSPRPLIWPNPYDAFWDALEQHGINLPDALAEVSTIEYKYEVVDFIYSVDDGYVAIRFRRDLRSGDDLDGLNYAGIRAVVPKDVVVRRWVTKPLDFTA